MSPMSCEAGSQKTAFVSRPTSKALAIARVLASRLAWVSITPLGRLVEPEVYWIIASESGSGSPAVQQSARASVSLSVAIQRTAAAPSFIFAMASTVEAVLSATVAPASAASAWKRSSVRVRGG